MIYLFLLFYKTFISCLLCSCITYLPSFFLSPLGIALIISFLCYLFFIVVFNFLLSSFLFLIFIAVYLNKTVASSRTCGREVSRASLCLRQERLSFPLSIRLFLSLLGDEHLVLNLLSKSLILESSVVQRVVKVTVRNKTWFTLVLCSWEYYLASSTWNFHSNNNNFQMVYGLMHMKHIY